MSTAIGILDEYLDPVAESFSPEVARKLVELRATPEQQARMDDLASKANEGELTPAEDAEYKARIEAIDIISIFQAKARGYLAKHDH